MYIVSVQSVSGSNAGALQGAPINTTLPGVGQCLAYDGTQWSPSSNCGSGGGGGTSITVNGGSPLTSPVNFANGSPVTGLQINVTATGSTITYAIAGQLANAGIANPSITVAGQTCTLGSSCPVNYSAITGTPTLYYQTVAVAGSSSPQEPKVNYIAGSNVNIACPDNPGLSRTDCTISVSGVSGNVSSSGTPISTQWAQWVSASAIQGVNGVGGGTNPLIVTATSPAQGQVFSYNSSSVVVNGYEGVNVNPQTGNYTLACPTDRFGEVEFNISTAATLSVPQAGSTTCLQANTGFVVRNAPTSTAVLTVTLTTSTFQPEGGSSHTILPGAGLFVYSDAVASTGNYHALESPASFGGVSVKTASYTATAADRNKMLVMNCTASCALTLPAAPPNSAWAIWAETIGSTVATISLNSLNFNGGATAPVLISYMPIMVRTDGTNYYGDAPLVAGTNVTLTPAANGITVAATGGGGSGSVTTVSCGNLSPLFTCSVATPTSTPVISYSATNFAANTVLGNPTGSSAAPIATGNPVVNSITAGTGGPACSWTTGNAGAICSSNGTPPTGVAGSSMIWGDGNNQGYNWESNIAGVPAALSTQHLPINLVLQGTAYTNATTSFTSVVGSSGPTLAFTANASTAYSGSCYLVYSASASTAGPKIQFTGPSSPTAVLYSSLFQLTATPTYADSAAASAFSTSQSAGTAVTATTLLAARINFSLINGTTAGTVTLQAAAQGTGTLTIEPASYCIFQ